MFLLTNDMLVFALILIIIVLLAGNAVMLFRLRQNATPQRKETQSEDIPDAETHKQTEEQLAKVNRALKETVKQSEALAKRAEQHAYEAETLRQATAAVASSLDERATIESILEQLKRVVWYDSASVQLREGDESVIVGGHGFKDQSVIGWRFPITETENNWQVYEHGETLIYDDIQLYHERFRRLAPHVRSWMGVPLIMHNEVLGLVAIDRSKIASFTAHDKNLATAFVNHVAVALENSHLYKKAVRISEQRLVLYKAALALNASLDMEHVFKTTFDAASQLMTCETFFIALVDDDQQGYSIPFIVDKGERLKEIHFNLDQGISGQVIRSGQAILREAIDAEDAQAMGGILSPNETELLSFVFIPLRLGEKVIGVLSAQTRPPNRYTLELQEALEQLSAQAATSIQNVRLFAETQRMAATDGLTGLLNHRHIMQLGCQEITRAIRYGHPLSVIMVDVDDFKMVNDRHVHLVGDQALSVVAQVFRKHVREIDLVARYGGEEFICLLPDTGLSQAKAVAERLRQDISAVELNAGQLVFSITASLGIATFNPSLDKNIEALIQRADEALYRAKDKGRNRVVCG